MPRCRIKHQCTICSSEESVSWCYSVQFPFDLSDVASDTITVFDLAPPSVISWMFSSSLLEVESDHSPCASFSHVGPCHHSSELTIVTAGTPRGERSAGFCRPGRCRHLLTPEIFCMLSTWCLTNGLHRFGSPTIQLSATRESDK